MAPMAKASQARLAKKVNAVLGSALQQQNVGAGVPKQPEAEQHESDKKGALVDTVRNKPGKSLRKQDTDVEVKKKIDDNLHFAERQRAGALNLTERITERVKSNVYLARRGSFTFDAQFYAKLRSDFVYADVPGEGSGFKNLKEAEAFLDAEGDLDEEGCGRVIRLALRINDADKEKGEKQLYKKDCQQLARKLWKKIQGSSIAYEHEGIRWSLSRLVGEHLAKPESESVARHAARLSQWFDGSRGPNNVYKYVVTTHVSYEQFVECLNATSLSAEQEQLVLCLIRKTELGRTVFASCQDLVEKNEAESKLICDCLKYVDEHQVLGEQALQRSIEKSIGAKGLSKVVGLASLYPSEFRYTVSTVRKKVEATYGVVVKSSMKKSFDCIPYHDEAYSTIEDLYGDLRKQKQNKKRKADKASKSENPVLAAQESVGSSEKSTGDIGIVSAKADESPAGVVIVSANGEGDPSVENQSDVASRAGSGSGSTDLVVVNGVSASSSSASVSSVNNSVQPISADLVENANKARALLESALEAIPDENIDVHKLIAQIVTMSADYECLREDQAIIESERRMAETVYQAYVVLCVENFDTVKDVMEAFDAVPHQVTSFFGLSDTRIRARNTIEVMLGVKSDPAVSGNFVEMLEIRGNRTTFVKKMAKKALMHHAIEDPEATLQSLHKKIESEEEISLDAVNRIGKVIWNMDKANVQLYKDLAREMASRAEKAAKAATGSAIVSQTAARPLGRDRLAAMLDDSDDE